MRAAGSQVSASYSVFPDDIRVPFQKRKFVGIPDGLFQYYDSEHSLFGKRLCLMYVRCKRYFAYGPDGGN